MVKISKQDKEILYNYSEVFERIQLTRSKRGDQKRFKDHCRDSE